MKAAVMKPIDWQILKLGALERVFSLGIRYGLQAKMVEVSIVVLSTNDYRT